MSEPLPAAGSVLCPMCGQPQEAMATSCARCGEPLVVCMPVSDADIRSFRSQTFALATVWSLLAAISGLVAIAVATLLGRVSLRAEAVLVAILVVACGAGAIAFGVCAALGFRLDGRGCTRGVWVWLCLIAVQFPLPFPRPAVAVIVVPQAILLALCFSQRERIIVLENRLRAAGLPPTIRPGQQHRPLSSPEGIRRPV